MSDLVVEDYLVELATVGATTVTAPAGLAQRVLAHGRRQRQRRWLTGVGGVAVLAAGVGVAGARLEHTGPLFAVIEPSASMQPTIAVSDSVTADRRITPARGDVVVATVTTDAGTAQSIKRVVALPGDTIRCPDNGLGRCTGLVLNGQRVDEPYVADGEQTSFGPLTVPDGDVFLLGDNRAASLDSRVYGPVSEDAIDGVVVAISGPDGEHHAVPGAPAHPESSGSVDPPDAPPPARVSTP